MLPPSVRRSTWPRQPPRAGASGLPALTRHRTQRPRSGIGTGWAGAYVARFSDMNNPKRLARWRRVAFGAGVLREPAPGDGRLILWVRTSVTRDTSIGIASPPCAVRSRACAVGFRPSSPRRSEHRQRIGRLSCRFLRWFRRASDDRLWLLPDGGSAERVGQRETDLLLVWGDHARPADEAQISACWPNAARARALAPNLFLIWGVAASAADGTVETRPEEGSSLEQAEQWLAAARRAPTGLTRRRP